MYKGVRQVRTRGGVVWLRMGRIETRSCRGSLHTLCGAGSAGRIRTVGCGRRQLHGRVSSRGCRGLILGVELRRSAMSMMWAHRVLSGKIFILLLIVGIQIRIVHGEIALIVTCVCCHGGGRR